MLLMQLKCWASVGLLLHAVDAADGDDANGRYGKTCEEENLFCVFLICG